MEKTFLVRLMAGFLLPISGWAQISNIKVTSAASFEPGLPARGSLGTIFCTGLTVEGVVSAEEVPLPTTLAGVTVTIGGALAPLLAVADLGGYQQINFQVPLESQINADGTTQVMLSQGAFQGLVTASNDPNAPGDFFRIPSTQYGIFQHAQDYSLVTKASPAVAGETIVAYLTGLPTAQPPVPTGQATPNSPLSVVYQMNRGNLIDQIGLVLAGATYVFDNGEIWGDSTGASPVSFIGLTPGSVGLYQVNFTLPASPPNGDVALQLARRICTPLFAACSPRDTTYYLSQTVVIPIR